MTRVDYNSKNPKPGEPGFFSPGDYTALTAYLDFSRKWHTPILKEVIRELKTNSAMADIFKDQDESTLVQQSERSQIVLQKAVASRDWTAYTQNLTQQGVSYAKAGLHFDDWLRIITLFRDHMHPFIIEEYPHDAKQASLIWQGINKLSDLALSIISASYFEEKNKQLQEFSENLEEKVEERTSELQSINAELESFSYTVSHDLRAPLRAINGYARILTKKAGDNLTGEQSRYLDVIIENVTRMGTLIDDLLLYSRTGRASLNKGHLKMNQLVEHVFSAIVDPHLDKKVELKVDDLPDAPGDWEMLKRVFSNLLANALKFSQHRDKPVISVTSSVTDKEIIYSVHDNGAGFEMDYVHKIFGIFQRLHSEDEYEGTGVGLAIVQRIIHKHGGRVWAEGEPGKGASFYFSLPKI